MSSTELDAQCASAPMAHRAAGDGVQLFGLARWEWQYDSAAALLSLLSGRILWRRSVAERASMTTVSRESVPSLIERWRCMEPRGCQRKAESGARDCSDDRRGVGRGSARACDCRRRIHLVRRRSRSASHRAPIRRIERRGSRVRCFSRTGRQKVVTFALEECAGFVGCDASPILDLGMRLGEGTGAALAIPVLRAEAAVIRNMATFASAGVSSSDQAAARE